MEVAATAATARGEAGGCDDGGGFPSCSDRDPVAEVALAFVLLLAV
jgi:hypothetical protein